METLTHALSGALVARLLPATRRAAPLSRRAAMLAGAAGAVFPDIDFALRLVDTLTYLNHHQGLTHSLILWPLWTLLLAFALARLSRGRYAWRAFLAPVAAGLAAHLLGDWITAYGIALFAPFSDRRYAADWIFLFDAGVTMILVLGLLAGWRWPTRRAIPAATLAALLVYIGTAAGLHRQAVELARDQGAPASPGLAAALPQPPAPWLWLLIVPDAGEYRVARVNLAARRAPGAPAGASWVTRYLAAFDAPDDLAWRRIARADGTGDALDAWGAPALAPLREFMRFPAVDTEGPGPGGGCVRFVDLRFTLPEMTSSFRYGACRAQSHLPWRLTRWRGGFYID